MKSPDVSAIREVQRACILHLLLDEELTTTQLIEKLHREPIEVARLLHTMTLQKLIRMKPLPAKLKARYAESEAVLKQIVAGKAPIDALEPYKDCTPVPYQITKAGRSVLAAL